MMFCMWCSQQCKAVVKVQRMFKKHEKKYNPFDFAHPASITTQRYIPMAAQNAHSCLYLPNTRQQPPTPQPNTHTHSV